MILGVFTRNLWLKILALALAIAIYYGLKNERPALEPLHDVPSEQQRH